MTTPFENEKSTPGPEFEKRETLASVDRWRSRVRRYGLALISIAATLAISIALTRNQISINLTILVVAALLIPTLYGGIGPGLIVAIAFEAITMISRPPAPDSSLSIYIFGHASTFALYIFLVLVVGARRNAERQTKVLNEFLEQRVQERTAELNDVNKELEAFSYSVSHDLRAPLRHINGFSLALLEDYDSKLDDVGKGYLKQIREGSEEMATLIDDVLRLAQLSRSEMDFDSVNFTAIANSIINDLRQDDPERRVVTNIERGLSTKGDAHLLEIMLTNLLGNAWKFTSTTQEAEITFGQQMVHGRSVYFIRDNGVGFDMQFADKLFGVFQRLHRSDEFEGTGIGLATVQRIINRHGGRVWADGKVGEGATFYFSLPGSRGETNER